MCEQDSVEKVGSMTFTEVVVGTLTQSSLVSDCCHFVDVELLEITHIVVVYYDAICGNSNTKSAIVNGKCS